MSLPLVSVILPVYNAESTILEAINSIIEQTYPNWELLLINDGSKDHTKEVIKRINDKRIRYIENDGNKGLIYTLNRGISLAKGEYIARMDSDDKSRPNRFEKQVSFLDSHKEVIVCGSFIEIFGDNINKTVREFKQSNEDIKQFYLLKTPFAHPAVMIRRSILLNNNICYDFSFKCAEDYKLWFDLMDYGEYYNIPEVLLDYRISVTQCTQPTNTTMINSLKKCRLLYVKKILGQEDAKSFKHNVITKNLLARIYRIRNVCILEAAYLSMKPFSYGLLFHLFTSGDYRKFTCRQIGAILKRFIGKRVDLF